MECEEYQGRTARGWHLTLSRLNSHHKRIHTVYFTKVTSFFSGKEMNEENLFMKNFYFSFVNANIHTQKTNLRMTRRA